MKIRFFFVMIDNRSPVYFKFKLYRRGKSLFSIYSDKLIEPISKLLLDTYFNPVFLHLKYILKHCVECANSPSSGAFLT